MNQKEDKERTKEKEENHHHHQRLIRAGTSDVCYGKIKMQKIYEAALDNRMPLEEANDWVDFMDETGWYLPKGEEVNAKNFRRSLRMWHKSVAKIEAQKAAILRRSRRNHVSEVDYDAQAKERANKIRETKAKDPAEWELCRERCTNCLECGGCPSFRIPPQLRERPIPPEECPGFARRADYVD